MEKIISLSFYDALRSITMYFVYGFVFLLGFPPAMIFFFECFENREIIGEFLLVCGIFMLSMYMLFPYVKRAYMKRSLLKKTKVIIRDTSLEFIGFLIDYDTMQYTHFEKTIDYSQIKTIEFSKYALTGKGYYKGTAYNETKFYGHKLTFEIDKRKKVEIDMINTTFERGQLANTYYHLKKRGELHHVSFIDPPFFAKSIPIEKYNGRYLAEASILE